MSSRTETLVITATDEAGQTSSVERTIVWTADDLALVVGSSKGSVGLVEVDRQFGGRAPVVRNFDDGAIPARWSETQFLPADNRPVIASIVVDPANPGADFEARVRAWLADAPAGRMVSVDHEGDAKVRKGNYTRAQWVALQERFLPIAAEMGMTPVAILTYQSLEDGTADSYWSPAMLAVPRVTLGFDTYQPGVPSATPIKMVGKMAPFAAARNRPFVIPEFGIGLANAPGATDVEKDQARAVQVAGMLTLLATTVSVDPNVGCKAACYWPSGNYVPGPATWAALRATYPAGA